MTRKNEEDDFTGVNADSPFAQSIQDKVERAIKKGLDAPDLASQLKAATLADKMGLLKVKDRNIEVSELSNWMVEVLLNMSVVTGKPIAEVLNVIHYKCVRCPNMFDQPNLPQVIE